MTDREVIERAYAQLWRAGPTLGGVGNVVRGGLLEALGGPRSAGQVSALAKYGKAHDHTCESGRDVLQKLMTVCGHLDSFRGIMADGPDDSDEALAENHLTKACNLASECLRQLWPDVYVKVDPSGETS